MREIEFRAWRKDTKVMIDCYTTELGFQDVSLNDFLNETDNLIFLQYTGLKDKNNKKIFEGDILKHYQDLHVIHWDEHVAGFSWRTCSMDTYLMFRKFVAENCEVVGNIYPNPELKETP